ncbi:MAG: diguanylate cyclase domain-containing protein [Polynucleobacter sp.]
MTDRRKENSSPIFYKLSAWSVSLSFIAILLSSVWTYYSVIQIYNSTYLKKAEQLARGAGLAIGDKLLSKDYTELESILKRLFLNKDLDLAVVADLNGKRVLTLKREKDAEPQLFFELSQLSIDKNIDIETRVDGNIGDKIKVLQKIDPGIPIGWLYLELSNTTEELILQKLKTNILLVAIPLFIVIVIISLFLNKNLKTKVDKNELLIKKEKNFWNSRAIEDPLTKLPNRLLLHNDLRSALAEANRMNSHVGIIFFDLDGFKQVNDQHGHQTGDLLLAEVAKRLVEYVRPGDKVIRYGGDEFIIIFNNLESRLELEGLIERLSEQINSPFDINGQTLNIRASIGVTFYPLDGSNDPEVLISHADEAMYVAKKLGKNQTYWYC